jgi:fructoselysine and glucoselysine-specific PTS system IIA component
MPFMDNNAKTRKFLIAAHGAFAAGVKSSLDLIIGVMDNLFILQAYVDENVCVEDDLKEILKQVNENDELVVFTDILGGSVTNQVLQHATGPNVYIISGFNLPLVIEVLLADADCPLEGIIEDAINSAKEQMVFVNKLISTQNTEDQG